MREAEERSLVILIDHREALDRLTDLLLDQETIDGSDVKRILNSSLPISLTG